MMESTDFMSYTEYFNQNGLPIIMADDDLIEHLHENGYEDTIDINEFVFEYLDWAKENVDE
jgi:hypothetical protein